MGGVGGSLLNENGSIGGGLRDPWLKVGERPASELLSDGVRCKKPAPFSSSHDVLTIWELPWLNELMGGSIFVFNPQHISAGCSGSTTSSRDGNFYINDNVFMCAP